ncbi:MAG: hypothetical protein M9884_17355 [Rhodocyclaceae bacterium]|nr:hypothetical protein [Rhodocyclaceae bacterium]
MPEHAQNDRSGLERSPLLTSAEAAELLRCSPKYFADNYRTAPGFPRPVHLPGKRATRGHPRWYREEVLEWVAAQRQRRKSLAI